MFPEYRDLITELKHKDLHFTKLFDKHNELDQKIKNIEAGIEHDSDMALETMKKEKLHLKDQLYAILQKATNA
jgi:uncharacterized protein YdcH (DUF465 family)